MKQDKELMKKMFKKGVAVFAAGTMVATMFAACGKKEAILSGTDLENAVVITMSNDVIIGKPYTKVVTNTTYKTRICVGTHYQDVITGNIYHVIPTTTKEVKDSEISVEKFRRASSCKNQGNISKFEDEMLISAITNQLTEEELKKASEDNFTDQDLINTQKRLSDAAKTKTLG